MARELRPEDNPATPCDEYVAIKDKWNRVIAVLGGTDAMRTAAKKYLPQHEAEEDHEYKDRLRTATLYNVTELTLNGLVGRPFSEPVKWLDESDETLVEYTEDIDLEGSNADVFFRHWFRDGVAKLISHVLVDMPASDIDPADRTRADDDRENMRPYAVHIPPENLFFWNVEVEDGREFLTEIRWMEMQTERVGFAKRAWPIIKQMELMEDEESGNRFVRLQVYEVNKEKYFKNREEEWIPTPVAGLTREVRIDEIPLVTYKAEQGDKPPLLDLVDANIKHWQMLSNYDAAVIVAMFPMIAGSGIKEENFSVVAGPKVSLIADSDSAKFYYLENEGKALAAGAAAIEKQEERMQQYGATFLTKRPGGATATARALDSAESSTPLQDMTIRFIDSASRMMGLFAKFEGNDPANTFATPILPTDFGPEEWLEGDMKQLMELRKNGDLSRTQIIEEARNRGMLRDEFDLTKNENELQQESTDQLENMVTQAARMAEVTEDDDPDNSGNNE